MKSTRHTIDHLAATLLLVLLLSPLFLAAYSAASASRMGVTERVSVSPTGEQASWSSGGNSLSADGRFVAFGSSADDLVSGDTNFFCDKINPEGPGRDNCSDIYVYDRQTGVTHRVSLSSTGEQGNHNSTRPTISADGRFVAFDSQADNLVSGDTQICYEWVLANKFEYNCSDVFVHDRCPGGECTDPRFYLPVITR